MQEEGLQARARKRRLRSLIPLERTSGCARRRITPPLSLYGEESAPADMAENHGHYLYRQPAV